MYLPIIYLFFYQIFTNLLISLYQLSCYLSYYYLSNLLSIYHPFIMNLSSTNQDTYVYLSSVYLNYFPSTHPPCLSSFPTVCSLCHSVRIIPHQVFVWGSFLLGVTFSLYFFFFKRFFNMHHRSKFLTINGTVISIAVSLCKPRVCAYLCCVKCCHSGQSTFDTGRPTEDSDISVAFPNLHCCLLCSPIPRSSPTSEQIKVYCKRSTRWRFTKAPYWLDPEEHDAERYRRPGNGVLLSCLLTSPLPHPTSPSPHFT